MMKTKIIDKENLGPSAQGHKILIVMTIIISVASSCQDGEDH
jgi:hypothetical protein